MGEKASMKRIFAMVAAIVISSPAFFIGAIFVSVPLSLHRPWLVVAKPSASRADALDHWN